MASTGTISTATGVQNYDAQSAGGASDAAIITFERVGYYSGYFGLDYDNQWAVGGASAGPGRYRLFHEGNFDPNSKLDKNYTENVTALGDVVTVNVQRIASYSGDNSGVSSGLRVYSQVQSGVTGVEWGFLTQLDNYAINGANQNSAFYAQGVKRNSGGTFAGVFEAREEPNVTYGPLVSLEVDNTANGGDPNNIRVAIDVVLARTSADVASGEHYTGLRIGTRTESGTDSVSTVKRPIVIESYWTDAAIYASNKAPLASSVNSTSTYFDLQTQLSSGGLSQVVLRERRTASDINLEFSRTISGTETNSLQYAINQTTINMFGETFFKLVRTGSNAGYPIVVLPGSPSGLPPGALWRDASAGNTVKAV